VKTPLEVVGVPPEALASNNLGKVGVSRSTKGLKFLRELVRIRLVLVLLTLLLAIALSRGWFGSLLGILQLVVLVQLSKLVEALTNILDLSLKSHDLVVGFGLLVGICLLDAVTLLL
jgi:hypothetical protein